METCIDIALLELKVKRLSTLIEVNSDQSSLNLGQILENVISISKKVMHADARSLVLIGEKAKKENRRCARQ